MESFLSYIHVTSDVCNCGCCWTQEIQVQMNTKATWTAMMAERNAFALPVHTWLVFPKFLHLNAIS